MSGLPSRRAAEPGQDLVCQAEDAVPIPIAAAAMRLELADTCAGLDLARGAAHAEMPLMPARLAALPSPP